MTDTLLSRIGENLYGQFWREPLAEYLGVTDRTMRRWGNGSRPIPPGIWKELFIKLDAALDEFAYLRDKLKERIDESGPVPRGFYDLPMSDDEAA